MPWNSFPPVPPSKRGYWPDFASDSPRFIPVGIELSKTLTRARANSASSTSGTPKWNSDSRRDSRAVRFLPPCISRVPKPSTQGEHVPEWYRDDGTPALLTRPLLPEYKLWTSLHGGNGLWKQQRAHEVWDQQLQEHAEMQREQAIREEHQRAMEAEAERRRKAEEEARRANNDVAEQERRRKLAQEEAERLAREAEAAEQRKLEEKERERRRRQPRPCGKCGETGKCSDCSGSGCVPVLYLSPSVSLSDRAPRGRLLKGCLPCGGTGDGASWGELLKGNGACDACLGTGKIKAPVTGWPDP